MNTLSWIDCSVGWSQPTVNVATKSPPAVAVARRERASELAVERVAAEVEDRRAARSPASVTRYVSLDRRDAREAHDGASAGSRQARSPTRA